MAKRGINKKNEQKLIEYLLRTTGDIQPLSEKVVAVKPKEATFLKNVTSGEPVGSPKRSNFSFFAPNRTTGDIQPLNPIATTSHKKRGRPIERDDRPERSAAKRTLLGEERYPITIKTDDKETMKEISKIKKCSIKQIYNEAISEYINKCINLG